MEDRSFADQITEVLDINFLELEYLKMFVGKLIKYRNKYGTHPSREALITIFKTEFENEDEVAYNQLMSYCDKIDIHEVTDTSYIKEVSL